MKDRVFGKRLLRAATIAAIAILSFALQPEVVGHASAPRNGTQITRPTSTTVLTTSAPSTVNAATEVHLTATVITEGSSDGGVQFKSNSVELGFAVHTSGGVAKLTTRLPAGTDNVTATFSGNYPTLGSVSLPLTFTVNKLVSHTVLTTTSSPTPPGDHMVNLTATVTGSHGVVPTGIVEFWAGSQSLYWATLDGGGVGTINYWLKPGTWNVTAKYLGDDVYKDSHSDHLVFTTTPPYRVSIWDPVHVSIPDSTGAVWVTFNITVRGATGNPAPTGTLTADSGFTCLPLTPKTDGTANSTSKCTHRVPLGAVVTVTFSYSGDAIYNASSTSATIDNGGGQSTIAV